MNMKQAIDELNRLRENNGKPGLSKWRGSTAELKQAINVEKGPPKTFGDPEAALKHFKSKEAPDVTRNAGSRGKKMWKPHAPSAAHLANKVRHGGRGHEVLELMTEGTHTVSAISQAIGQRAIVTAYCMNLWQGIGYRFKDPATGEWMQEGTEDSIIVAWYPEGMDLSTAVKEPHKR